MGVSLILTGSLPGLTLVFHVVLPRAGDVALRGSPADIGPAKEPVSSMTMAPTAARAAWDAW